MLKSQLRIDLSILPFYLPFYKRTVKLLVACCLSLVTFIMNLRYRRLLYLAFIAFFLAAAPIIILYAAGYRYNFKRQKIEKTGILYVESKPADAAIYLNGQYQAQTPARFTRLLPDSYSVRVEKEGYFPWEKEAAVKSNLTAFYKDIVLFKKNLPILLAEGKIDLLAASPDGEKIVYRLDKNGQPELRLLLLKNEIDFLIADSAFEPESKLEFLGWSAEENKALILAASSRAKKYLILDLENLKIKEMPNGAGLNFDKIKWDLSSGNYLYGQKGQNLYQIDLANTSAKILINAPISDFQIQGNNVYYLTKVANESFLNKLAINLEGLEKPRKIKLPAYSDYSLLPPEERYLILLDEKNRDLSVLKAESFADAEIEKNIVLQEKAKEITWSQDRKNLLAWTDFEIWTFDFSGWQKNLVTRLGGSISQALWHPGNKYVIYRLGNAVFSIETGGGEIKNDLKLFELNKIENLSLDRAGKNLYFKGQAGEKQGLYKVELQ